MSGNKRKIFLLITYISGSILFGVFLMFLVLLFSIISAGNSLSINSLNKLYTDYNEFYLLNLLPLITGITGAWVATKVSEFAEKAERKIVNHKTIQDRIIEFVNHIEKHNLNIPFKPVNGEILLETALESMRKSIISTSQKEFERNEINRISHETITLLQSFTDIDRLGEETIAFLVKKIGNVVQGAFYVVESDGEENKVINLKASYAYNRKKYLNARFRFAQGLVGQAAVEKDIIVRTEIPDDYLTIKSGLLGEKKPGTIIISPLITNDTVYGVIELAAFSNFSTLQYNMIREISTIIARSIASININLTTYSLLQKSEKMSTELQYQKKQLIQNAEDLLKTQEELKKSNAALEEQIQEVHNTNKRSQVLLENAKEVITIFSENFRIKYVSPSIKSIMGYYPEEILGKEDAENVHPLDTEKFRKLLNDLRSFPEKELTLQYRYFTKEGDVIWMEAKGKNLLSDNVIRGFVINSSDISEQRIAEKEQRIRAKMQALSENSSDLIIRVDIFTRCTYINPVIEEYTGAGKASYINHPLGNTDMDKSVVLHLKQLLEEVSITKSRKNSEMIFPVRDGNRVMHVSAIPEFNEAGDAESVLFACHDITEAKAREELIRKKNKSISDSINYALNIQSALMPTEANLHKILPNSFMFYKPKDIVSGDYPWLFKKGDSIYVGAMDCTGHGVPGALMSIIGFFLQDAIINRDDELNAGEVLNKLHYSVVDRLKQAEPGSKINDGMDAAFCRINLKKKELDFAGAHRALYHVSKNQLNEIKGDKFPVGSTQYRNRKDFINNKIKILPGDSVYFMTDGFPDQFGGPTGKQRFTSDSVGRLIQENTHLSIFQMGHLFRNTYENWKGSINQLDDVLVIGLKF